MNILIVCNKFPYPLKDGGQIATFSMIKGMSDAGHSVTVAAINTSKHYYDVSALPESIKKIAEFRSIFLDTKLTVKDAFKNLFFSSLPYTATRFIVDEFSLLLKKILLEKDFDVVQLEGLYMCSYIPMIRKVSSAKISYRAHNVEYEIWKRLAGETTFFLKKMYLQNLAKRVESYEKSQLNTYDFLVPITKRDGDTYNAIGNKKLQCVAPTGISSKSIKDSFANKEEKLSLFHLGALDWAPNQQGIIWFLDNCWKQLREIYPDLELYVAGRNAPSWFVNAIAVDGVLYLGEVADAYEFMSQHTIMIVPLLAGGGMRIKILEGLANGNVVVSTSIGAEGIPAENGKNIFIANTSQEYISAIKSLMSGEIDVHSIGENAKSFIKENFDNTSIVSGLLDFYQNQIKKI
ncbi:MAG: glycosyltransferase family 4 protein [Bacteroidales bacterium]|nr:glycosyltransferase family 4 protein [Bacteroidales bacterium]